MIPVCISFLLYISKPVSFYTAVTFLYHFSLFLPLLVLRWFYNLMKLQSSLSPKGSSKAQSVEGTNKKKSEKLLKNSNN